MEKMIVTRALDERDLLIKKINDAIDRASFVTVKKTSDDVIIGGKKSVQEFDDEARADLQSIRDLISRYNRLDAAILLANGHYGYRGGRGDHDEGSGNQSQKDFTWKKFLKY